MKYYASYKPETGKTHIIAYDEAKRGAPRIVNDTRRSSTITRSSSAVSITRSPTRCSAASASTATAPSFCRMAARRRRTGSLELPAPRTCSSVVPM